MTSMIRSQTPYRPAMAAWLQNETMIQNWLRICSCNSVNQVPIIHDGEG